MDRRLKAALSASLTLTFLTILPTVAKSYLPREMVNLLAQASIDIGLILTEVAVIGVALACLNLVKGLIGRASPIHLAASAASSVSWLLLGLVLLGLGRVESMGLVTATSRFEMGTNSVALDLRLFAYLSVATAGLKVLQSALAFREARLEGKATEADRG